MSALLALIKRDMRLAMRVGGGALMGALFFLIVVVMMPFALGPDLNLLARIGPAILWLGALLASLLALDRLFATDHEDGSLDVLMMGPLPLEVAVAAKAIAHWLTTGLPLTLLSPLLGVLFGLPPNGYGPLMLSLAIGTPAVSAVGAIGAALTLSIRRGGVILPFIVLPLLAPAAIFGSGAVLAALDGLSNGAFWLLGAFSLVTVLLAPFASAAAVRLNLAG